MAQGIRAMHFTSFSYFKSVNFEGAIHAAGNGIADGNEIRPLPIADGNGQTAMEFPKWAKILGKIRKICEKIFFKIYLCIFIVQMWC